MIRDLSGYGAGPKD